MRPAACEPDPPKGALAESGPRSAVTRWGWLTGVLLLIGVVLVATHRAEERELARILREAKPLWILAASLLQLANFLLDALTLGATRRAVATPVAFSLVFASFVLASVVSTLAWVPGGLGTFEGTCVALLHVQGVTVEAALAATLLLRGLTFWLPMLPGLVLARREAGGASLPAVRA